MNEHKRVAEYYLSVSECCYTVAVSGTPPGQFATIDSGEPLTFNLYKILGI